MVIGKPFLTTEQIQNKVAVLADRIYHDYLGKDILAIGILKGSFMFFSDLVRAIRQPITVDFVVASSYIKTTSTGEVKVHYDVQEDIMGKDVLLIDDIVDTGISLNYIRERILAQSPQSVKICALLDKKERRIVDVNLDYVGFEIPNVFVVGYGLDYGNQFRNLPYIAIFKKKT
ncbi:MAG: hypoxanthine phosphoribosyltransferase [Dissulfurispiraceae bacterium]